MRIALAAAAYQDGNVAHNLDKMLRFMGMAKAAGTDLVCFGEAFLQGFDALCWDYQIDKDRALPVDAEPVKALCEATKTYQIDLLFGFLEKSGEEIYSSCALVSAGRIVHLYRRISKGWKEYTRTDCHYKEGTEVPAFTYNGKRALIAICGDLWDYPERFRLGQDILLWPVLIGYTPEEWYGQTELEYAQQAQKVCDRVLMINSISGTDAFGGCWDFEGGQIRASIPMGQEGLLFVDI